jgi:hypothetical protein
MWNDAIVDEVRANRDEHARKLDYDLDAIMRDLKNQEHKSVQRVVSLPPKAVSPLPKSA